MSRLKFWLTISAVVLMLDESVVNAQSPLTLLTNVNIAFTNLGTQTSFTVTSPLGNGVSISNSWLAVGLNSNSQMNGASVVMCKNPSSGSSAVDHYFNNNYATDYLDTNNPTIGISQSNLTVTQMNGVSTITCQFYRDNSNANSNYFNLNANTSPYVLAAYGTLGTNNVPNYHGASNRFVTTNTVSFAATSSSSPASGGSSSPTASTASSVASSTTSATTTGMTASTQSKAPGTYFGSFSTTNYLIAWIDTPAYTDFTFTCFSFPLSSGRRRRDTSSAIVGVNNVYMAMGLSQNNQMGNNDVIACKIASNIGTVEHYYNPGGYTPSAYIDPTQPTLGISNANLIYNNSVLVCSFRRSKSTFGFSQYFDLNNQYYILIAQGQLDSNKMLTYHGVNKLASSSAINFQANFNGTGVGTVNNDKAKAHGCLMVFAWMLIASTGILTARYFRFLDAEILKKQLWFQIHRSLMISIPVISIVAFIVILADLKWTWVTQDLSINFAHSIIGMITIGLSFIQVGVAFFRPHPGTPRRPLFNIFHRSVGLSAFVLSTVTIFLGVFISRMNLGQAGYGIMIGWVIWVFVIPSILETIPLLFRNGIASAEAYRIDDNNKINHAADATQQTSSKNKGFIQTTKLIFMMVHVVAAFTFAIALIVIIAISSPQTSS